MKQNNSTANVSECQDALATTANTVEIGSQAPMNDEPPAWVDEPPIPEDDGAMPPMAGQEENTVQEEAPHGTEPDSSPARWTPEERRAMLRAKRRERAERRESRKSAQVPAPGAGVEVVEEDAVQGTRMPLPPDPPKIWHPRAQDLLADAARAFSVPVQVPEAALWGLCSGCIGGTRTAWVNADWRGPGNMLVILVGRSGLGKSPVTDAFFRHFEMHERAIRRDHKQKVQRYQDEHAAWEGLKGKDRGDEPKAPNPMLRFSVKDTTPEALVQAMSINPRGVWWRTDEASSLLGGMDRYAGGKASGVTRGIIIDGYDRRTIDMARVDAARERYAPNATLSLFGNIQPRILPKVTTEDDNAVGLLQRIIFIRAVRTTPRENTRKGLTPESYATLEKITTGLLALAMDSDGNLDDPEWRPRDIPLSDEAWPLYDEWTRSISMEEVAGAFGQAEEWAAKIQGHALRGACVLHCVDAVLEDRAPEASLISAATMRRAIEWADWVRDMQMQVLGIMQGKYGQERSPVEQAIMRVFADARKPGKPLVALLSSDITTRVNAELKASGQDGYSAETVGKVLLQLSKNIPGLRCARISVDGKRGRGWRANGTALTRMRQELAPADDEEGAA